MADQNNATRPMTDGEWRVGVDFNPSSNALVTAIKLESAALIDRMLVIANDRNHPGARNAALAATEFENAAMNAVKAITKRPRT